MISSSPLRHPLSFAVLAFFAGLLIPAASVAQTRGTNVVASTNNAASALDLYGESHALVIGISKYSTWPSLANAAQDAYRVKDVLEEHGFQVSCLVDQPRTVSGGSGACVGGASVKPKIDARTLTDTIRRFLVEKGQDPTSRLLIWYAGHGYTVATSNSSEGVLVGSDAPSHLDERFPLDTVQIRDVGNWVRLASSIHVLVVFDSCFSATVFESRQHVRPGMDPRIMLRTPVRQFMASGGPNEEVLDDSVFAREFIRALRGEAVLANPNCDNLLTASELGLYLAIQVQKATRAQQTPQYGELLGGRFDRGNFAFAWNGGCTDDSLAPPMPRATPNGNDRVDNPDPEPPSASTWVPVPFRDCDTCPELVTLPLGDAQIGDALQSENIEQAFAIGVHEITFAEWDRCVAGGGCPHRPDDAGWGRDRRPVMRVSRTDIDHYLKWLERETGHVYRLPTEIQWEYAARSGTDTVYWFGNEMEQGRANCSNCGLSPVERTTEVGSFGVDRGATCGEQRGGENCFGLHDLHGNVWEWVADCEVDEDETCRVGVIRGGSWANNAHHARAASRTEVPVDLRSTGVGFRVVRELPSRPDKK